MTRAIIWKEWKRLRGLLLAFLLAAILIPAIPGQLLPNEGETAQTLILFMFTLFCLFSGIIFYEQKRRGTIHFLLSRPATKPYLFVTHYLSYALMLAALLIISLSAHYVHMTFRFPHFSPLDMLLEPELVIDLALCLFFLSLSLFVANSAITFGSTTVGIAFIIMLVLPFVFHKQVSSFASSVPPLGPRESPVTFLWLLLCGGVFLGVLSLWEIAFDELRDAKNARWIRALVSASALSVIMIAVAAHLVARATVSPSEKRIQEVIATGVGKYPVACVVSDGRRENGLVVVKGPPYFLRGKFIERKGNESPVVKSGDAAGRFFVPVVERRYQASLLKFAYFSDKPILGQEIRAMGANLSRVNTISPKHYSRRESFGPPFPSPDGDRVAYLKTSSSRFGKESSASLWITKLYYTSVSDFVDLPNDAESTFEPIGWTPDGYDFMLREKGPKGPRIWAVDWVATGIRPFLDEFPDAVITGHDLPKAGEWMSLLRKETRREWAMWLVNYRSGESKKLGAFKQPPLRAWTPYGNWFAYWTPESGLVTYNVSEDARQPAVCPHAPSIRQMKWSPPPGSSLAIVAVEPEEPHAKAYVALFNPTNCSVIKLIDGFAAPEKKWGWLSSQAIVYADGGELWQVDLLGKRTLISSTIVSSKN